MMQFYYVKKPLYGVKQGTVERFAPHKAGALVLDGSIEPYDEKRHASAPGSPAQLAKQTAARAEAKEQRQETERKAQKTK